MVRAAKSTASKQTTTPATVAPVENVVVQATASSEKKTKKAKAESKTEAPAQVASTTVEQSATEATVTEPVSSPLSVKMTEFDAKLQQLSSIFSTVKSEFKSLSKEIQREMKAAQKSSSKKTKRSGNRQPSGFVKPTLISEELAQFLGKTSGTEMARTAVSKEINQYIRANNLQDKDNGRKINPDAKLTQLLKLTSADELTYFNLQRFMKNHFMKKDASVVSAATA